MIDLNVLMVRETDVGTVHRVLAAAGPDATLQVRATPPIDALLIDVLPPPDRGAWISFATTLSRTLDTTVWVWQQWRGTGRSVVEHRFLEIEGGEVADLSFSALARSLDIPALALHAWLEVPPLVLPRDIATAAAWLADPPPLPCHSDRRRGGFLIERSDRDVPPIALAVVQGALRDAGESLDGRDLLLSAVRGMPLVQLDVSFHPDDLRRFLWAPDSTRGRVFADLHPSLATRLTTALGAEVTAWSHERGSSVTDGHPVDLLLELHATTKLRQPLGEPWRPERWDRYQEALLPRWLPVGPDEDTLQTFALPVWMIREAEEIGARLGYTWNQVFGLAWELGARGRRTPRLPADLIVGEPVRVPAPASDGEVVRARLAVRWAVIDEGLDSGLGLPTVLAETWRDVRAELLGASRR